MKKRNVPIPLLPRALTLAVSVGVALCPTLPTHADWVWKPETGWLDPNKIPRGTAQQRYQHALVLLTQGHGKSAARELKRVVKEFPKAKWAEAALFYIGEAYYLGGYYTRCAEALEKYLDAYPAGSYSEQALSRMLSAGVLLSEKERSTQASVDVLDKVIELAPVGDLADDASDAIGDAYFRAGHYDEAVDAYRNLAVQFPTSEWVQAAPFKIGRCYMRKGSHLLVNPEAYAEARAHFGDYVRKYPEGVRVEEAQVYIKKATALQARSEYRLAEFYVRVRKPRSAAIYLTTVVEQFPETDHARRAEALLARLREMGVIE